MLQKSFKKFVSVLFFLSLFATYAFAEEADPCKESGIIVKNFTLVDRWYKKNNGNCTIWNHHHIFTIRQEDTIEIFSDMTCRTFYCRENPLYKEYLSADENVDCAVKFLLNCSLSDM